MPNSNKILWSDVGGVFVGTAYLFGDQTGNAGGGGAGAAAGVGGSPGTGVGTGATGGIAAVASAGVVIKINMATGVFS